MKCELCKDQEATIHLTQVVDSAVKKVHLCEACAEKHGFDVHGPMSITDILLGLGEQQEVATSATKEGDQACPTCHLRRADFKKSGRLGCPDCYAAFQDELQPLLKAMQRAERHKGKVPVRERGVVQVEALQKELEQAVMEERFEDAARLRDEIQGVKRRSPVASRKP